MRRIGVLMHLAADDPEGQIRLAAFLQGLQEAGWAVGRNITIDVRWAAADVWLLVLAQTLIEQFDGPPSASPAIKNRRADPRPEVLSAIWDQTISFLPPAYRGARVISTDTVRISLVLEVSRRQQEPE